VALRRATRETSAFAATSRWPYCLLVGVSQKVVDYAVATLRFTEGGEMRQAFMSKQRIIMNREDMTLYADSELGDFGACRRR
jgi:hypothetical protein